MCDKVIWNQKLKKCQCSFWFCSFSIILLLVYENIIWRVIFIKFESKPYHTRSYFDTYNDLKWKYSMNMVKPVGMTALWLIWISSPYLLEKDPFLKASQSTDGSMKEELKQNKQKRKDICSDECTTQNLVFDIDLKFFSYYSLN